MIRFARTVPVVLLAAAALPGARGQSAYPPDGAYFADYAGEVGSASRFDTVPLKMSSSDFTAPRMGAVLVGFDLRSPSGSEFDPAVLRVSAPRGIASRPVAYGSANTAAGRDSVTLAWVSPGRNTLTVRGERNTTGPYLLRMFLAGDVNADMKVDRQDLVLIRAHIRSPLSLRPGPPYDAAYDVDRNGVVNAADLAWANRNIGAATRLRLVSGNPLDQFLPQGALTLSGVSATAFNPLAAPLKFTLTRAAYSSHAGDFAVSVNGTSVPRQRIAMDGDTVTASSALVDGRNDIAFDGVDSVGRPLHLRQTVWAGSHTLEVRLADEAGQPFTDTAQVTAGLADDQSVTATASTSNGSVLFENVPERTLLIRATASGNRAGSVGTIGSAGLVTIRLLGFHSPTATKNHDFAQGTAGWDVGSAPVTIVPHVEGFPAGTDLADRASRPGGNVRLQPVRRPARLGPTPSARADATDNDLALATSGEGEQAISYTFNTDPGTSSVRVRYRFITSEVPGGYFGSEYNDYYRVAIRSLHGGGDAGEANTMNGLGLAAFDYNSGATEWRDATLAVDPAGDTIQVDAAVANVADDLLDSEVIIDFVAEDKDQIRPHLAWNNTQGGLNLTYDIVDGALKKDGAINVQFANGPAYSNRLGGSLFTLPVPTGTAEGAHGPVHVAGTLLAGDPAGTTHLIAFSSPDNVGPVPDVKISFGANADSSVVTADMIDILKDGLRAAGQAQATITSTARTPADQARAMFNNLVNPAHPVATNVANQLALYAAPGDAVIQVFVSQTQGKTLEQIVAAGDAIKSAMEAEIVNQGPSNVSKHCADPAEICVVDISAGAFTAQNGPLFVSAVSARVTKYLDERSSNGCYHFELQ